MPRSFSRGTRGFTLVELLVTVAIVAVLASFAMGALQGGLARSRQAACSSNMRQIGAALSAYAAENSGQLPQTSHTGSKLKSWIYTLAPYLDNVDKIRICPSDPFAKKRLAEKGTSYTLNSIVFNPVYDGDGNLVTKYNRLLLIPKLSQTILACIVSDQKFGLSADHTHSETWQNWTSVLVDISPDRHRAGQPAPDRTKGTSNYLYADGHVEPLTALELKILIDRGTNPAVPPT